MINDTLGKTSKLYGDLWQRYDNELFEQSVALFATRFRRNGFNLKWFEGKQCLDAGCGGGRYSVALARLGASKTVGCDISLEGLFDANYRSKNLRSIFFVGASVESLPFPDDSFDFVCCSGVLHHTFDSEQGLHELGRVLRLGGRLFLLLYGKGGLRWPTIMEIRPLVQAMGYDLIDEAMKIARLPANKQRTFLDDFFVPMIRFYDWEEVRQMLMGNNFNKFERWEKGQLDHEESVSVQRFEFEQMDELFQTMLRQKEPRFTAVVPLSLKARHAVRSAMEHLDRIEEDFLMGRIEGVKHRWQVFGWGHHRVLAIKG